MFTHRFEEQLMQDNVLHRTPGPAPCAFVLMPIDPQGADWKQWLYQMAFEEARQGILADRRARMLMASRN